MGLDQSLLNTWSWLTPAQNLIHLSQSSSSESPSDLEWALSPKWSVGAWLWGLCLCLPRPLSMGTVWPQVRPVRHSSPHPWRPLGSCSSLCPHSSGTHLGQALPQHDLTPASLALFLPTAVPGLLPPLVLIHPVCSMFGVLAGNLHASEGSGTLRKTYWC